MVAGRIDAGSGPTIERTGEAFLAARDRIERAKVRRERLVAHTGDPGCDALLADLAPALPALLGDLTDRQRALARLVLVDGLRRADVAERLSVSRATVSVMAERAHVRELGGLAAGLASVFRDGESVASGEAAAVPGIVTAGAGAR
jgi:ParB-like chromosome segregation protein Spo0J